ncbi:MAG: hypothetical protein KY410_10985 [Proteobacteria bacterium]|nr:hypothetical protein [Pseudomonadota bacterium]
MGFFGLDANSSSTSEARQIAGGTAGNSGPAVGISAGGDVDNFTRIDDRDTITTADPEVAKEAIDGMRRFGADAFDTIDNVVENAFDLSRQTNRITLQAAEDTIAANAETTARLFGAAGSQLTEALMKSRVVGNEEQAQMIMYIVGGLVALGAVYALAQYAGSRKR